MSRSDDSDPAAPHPRAREPRRRRAHRPHLDPPGGDRIMRVERLRDSDMLPPAAASGAAPDDPVAAGYVPEDGALPGDEAVLLELATAPVQRMARIVYSSNATFVLELDTADPFDSSQPLRAVYKPTRGERPLWDFPHRTLHCREVATYLVSAALGLNVVPPTALRDGPLGPGSAQLFIDTAGEELTDDEDALLDGALQDIAALDVLVNNADRKRAHLLVTRDKQLRAIDHGLTFLPYPRQRTVLIDLGGSPLPPDIASRVRLLAGDPVLCGDLRRRLGRLLAPAEADAFTHRLTELAADPTYPLLDPWDGRPFEWW